MRIGLTLEQLWHRVPGGVASFGQGLAAALAARDDLDVVGVAARHRAAPDPAWRTAVPVRHLPLPRALLYEAWQRAGRPTVESATGPVDVVHATTVVWPATRRPVVSTVHDLAFLDTPEHFPPRGRRLFTLGFERARDSAAALVCVSEATRLACVAHGVDEARLRVVAHGVDAEPATELDRAVARHVLAPAGGRPTVVFLGTLEPRKNLRGLVAALRRPALADAALVLVGPDGWDANLTAALAPVADRTVSVGFVPVGLRRGLLAEADVVVYPSLLEGFGLPIVEALAQGAAVVTSSGGATEEATGGLAGLADPRDPDALAAAIAAALADPRPDDAAARRAWAGRFTWAAAADAYATIYREVAA